MRKTTTAICVLLALSAGPALVTAQQNLFTPLGGTNVVGADSAGPDEVGTLRTRRVAVSFGQLAAGPVASADTSNVAPALQLNLFPDAIFTAQLVRVEMTSGGYAWLGHVTTPDNFVVLAVRGDIVAGNISVDGKTFQLRPDAAGAHTVSEVDLSQLPPEMEPLSVAYSEPEPELDTASDDGSFIDVMVVYTQPARIGAGGTSQIQALIDLAVVETNASYANSGVQQRLQLVHTAEVSYTETGNMNTDLNALTLKTDGKMDSVHALRDTHRADEVVLLVENGGAYCGIAWMMSTVSSTFESLAFSVVDTSCATGYYSFGHELGHNMGARHDRYVDNTDGFPFFYNHGYVNTVSRWRTVMAYNSACAALGFNCTRLPYWSNPDVNYLGAPTGVPEGQANAADNRKTLNNTAFTVANFRQAALPTFTLTVTKAGTGSGTVTSVPTGINCGSDCSEAFTSGTNVTLTASPSVGSVFAGWAGPCTGTGTCALNMSQNRSVTATFVPDATPTITIASPDGNTWTGGTVHTVSWTSADLDPSGRVYLYYFDGAWQYIADLPPTATSYGWTLPLISLDSGTFLVGNYVGSAWEIYDTTVVSITPPSSVTSFFYTVDPCRVLDTRSAGPALSSGVGREFQVGGVCGVPVGAKAVSVNVAVTGPTASGNLRLHAGDTPVPLVSAINYSAGATRSNNAVIPLNALGELAVLADQGSGTVHFILDVNGYFQ